MSGGADSIAAEWAEPGVFLTEASFLPLGEDDDEEEQEEDRGALLCVLYNATADESFLGIFNVEPGAHGFGSFGGVLLFPLTVSYAPAAHAPLQQP